MAEIRDEVVFLINEVKTMRDEQAGRNRPPGFDDSSGQRASSSRSTAKSHAKHGKIELPVFSTSEPSSWLIRANNYFDIFRKLEEMKGRLATRYMDEDAIQWSRSVKD
ncbi:hypothetical protein ACLOJK_026060 [Asimina triloba]